MLIKKEIFEKDYDIDNDIYLGKINLVYQPYNKQYDFFGILTEAVGITRDIFNPSQLLVSRLSNESKYLAHLVDWAKKRYTDNTNGFRAIKNIHLGITTKNLIWFIDNLPSINETKKYILHTTDVTVLNRVPSENVIIVDYNTGGKPKVKIGTETYCQSIDSICKSALDIDSIAPPFYEKWLEQLYQDVTDHRIELAEARLNELNTTIKGYESNIITHPELMRAKFFLDRKKEIGK